MRLLQRIVRNEAMEKDPPEIYGWRVFVVAATACLGGMLFGMDTGTISGVLVLPAFKREFGLEHLGTVESANLSANIVSALQAGCFLGAIVSWPVADSIGRKSALIVAPVIATVGIAIQAGSSGFLEAVYAGRVVAGVGVGMASVAVPLYISENAPRAIRGALTGLYQLSIVLGIMVSFWIDYASLLHISGNATWIVPIALQALPAVLLFFGMLFCNETPRHLAKQNDWDNAKATLAKVRSLPQSHPYVETEFGVIRAQLERERILGRGSTFMAMQKEMWKIPGNRKRVLISISLMIAQQMTGVNALNYYAPKIFQGLGLRDLNVSLFATGIYGVVKVVGCTCFLVFAADSLGRRRSLLWTAICQAAVMFYIGLYVRIHPQVNGERLPAAGYVALVCIYLFAAIYQFGWGPVPWIYIAEIPTMRLRSLNVAIGACTQWLFNFVVARSTPNMLATLGPGGYGTYLVFGSLSVFMFIFTWFFVPETKGMFIEEMDDLFGVLELAKRMLEEAELENGGPLRSSTYTDPGDLASCRSHPAKGNSSMRFKKCLMRNQMVEWITNIFSRILGSKSLRGKDHQEAFRKLCRQTFSTTTAGGSFSTASFAPIRHPAACGRLARKMSKENRSAANSYLLLV